MKAVILGFMLITTAVVAAAPAQSGFFRIVKPK